MKTFLFSMLATLLVVSGLSVLVYNNRQPIYAALHPPEKVVLSADSPTVSLDTSSIANLPLSKSVFRLRVNPDRILRLNGEIDRESADTFIEGLARLNLESSFPITVIISSPGGSVLDGGRIVDAIEASRSRVNTVCIDVCASMAAIIHQYGFRRFIYSRALLMFHPAFGGAQDDIDRMASMLQFIQRYAGKMEANVARRSGLSFEEYKRLSATQIWIDGEDAVNRGMADRVVFIENISPSLYTSHKGNDSKDRLSKFLVKALRAGIDALQPGPRADSIDAALRRNFNDLPGDK